MDDRRSNPIKAHRPSERPARFLFARRVSPANPIPSRAEWKSLDAAGFEPGAIKALAFVAALNVYYNRLAALLAVPTASIAKRICERTIHGLRL